MILLLATALLLAACDDDNTPDPTPTGPTSHLGAWLLTTGDHDGDAIPIPTPERITLTFQPDALGGVAACNNYGADVEVDGSSLTMGDIGQTAIACRDNLNDIEAQYLAALAQVDRFEVAADHLILRGPGVELTFDRLPDAPTAAVVDQTWTLQDPTEDGPTAPTLRLHADGTLEGGTGCRTLTGDWVEAGDEILATSLRADGDYDACAPALQEQDRRVIDVIGDGFRMQLQGDRLTLTSRDGSTLILVPAVQADATASPPEQAASSDRRSLTGLTPDPQPIQPPDQSATLPGAPSSPFPGWNGEDVVLFDVQAGSQTNYGPGAFATFSPEGTRLAWLAGGPADRDELFVVDLASGEPRSLGPGRAFRWVNEATLVVSPPDGSNQRVLVDVHSGARGSAGDITLDGFERPIQAGRWRLERIEQSEYPSWESTFELADMDGAFRPLRFDAYRATITTDGMLFLATVPDNPSGPPDGGPHLEFGATNIHAVDPETGEATYLATAIASAPNWAFDASATHVAWMDGFCADEPTTRILDRSSGSITEFDQGYWLVVAPDGRLGVGAFGPQALVNIDTFEYTTVLPEGVVDVSWTPDYTYAALGALLGHGGLC